MRRRRQSACARVLRKLACREAPGQVVGRSTQKDDAIVGSRAGCAPRGTDVTVAPRVPAPTGSPLSFGYSGRSTSSPRWARGQRGPSGRRLDRPPPPPRSLPGGDGITGGLGRELVAALIPGAAPARFAHHSAHTQRGCARRWSSRSSAGSTSPTESRRPGQERPRLPAGPVSLRPPAVDHQQAHHPQEAPTRSAGGGVAAVVRGQGALCFGRRGVGQPGVGQPGVGQPGVGAR
jgi:hypothetical protein